MSGLPPPMLFPSMASFVVDPDLADAIELERPPMHAPTTGPNRYTVHVPFDTSVLSLGNANERPWRTDVGITGHTTRHIRFEVTKNTQTVVSLGGPAVLGVLGGHGAAPKASATKGYVMVTSAAAWHDSQKQQYLLARSGDTSLRTRGGGKRAVVQADHGSVNVIAGKKVNIAGGGVSIGAGELELEDVRYAGSWAGKMPRSTGAIAGRIATAAAAAARAAFDIYKNVARDKFKEGSFTGGPEGFGDVNKRAINKALFGVSMVGLIGTAAEKAAPPKCVKLDAEETLLAAAGHDVGLFGMMTASFGSGVWTTVSAGAAASLKGVAFGGVSGAYVSGKGYKKVEIGSDYGKVFVGAQKAVHLGAEKKLAIGAPDVAHVASPEGDASFGGATKVHFGTTAGGGWGAVMSSEGFHLGKASDADDLAKVKILDEPAIHVGTSAIEVKAHGHFMKLDGDNLTIQPRKNRKVRFEASSGPVTVNGASKIYLKP